VNATELSILAMEKRYYQYASSKEEAIRNELSLSPIRYYQKLAAIIDDPEATAAEPVLTGRLRRIRDRASERRCHRPRSA
jgi:hypothetical protein